ncbi:MAG: glycosyltransferase family 4 protein [Promethearchaeota archaeon]
MRILRLIPNFYPLVSGPANQAYHISQGLEKNNMRSPIITSDFGLKEPRFTEIFNKVKCLRFKSIFNIFQYSITPQLIKYLYNEKYDIIHAHSYRNFQSDIAFLISKIKKVPLVINTHGTVKAYLNFKNRYTFKVPYKIYDFFTFRSVLRKADAIVVATKQEFNEIKEFGIDENKVHVIPAGINLKFPKKSTKFESNKKIKLLFVGRISRNRRVELILMAFKILFQNIKDIELWIVGGEERSSYTQQSGYMKELIYFCKKYNIHKNVHFTGNLSQNIIRDYYINSDIFVYTSDYENFGQTILEAAAAGLPLICTPVGIANDIIKDGKSGFLTFFNPKEIADKIKFLILNEKERNKFGQLIQDIVKKKYRWEKIIEQYIKLYHNLL